MEVKHSKYFNYDAEEIVKGYLSRRLFYIIILSAILLWVIFDNNISLGWRMFAIEIPAIWIIFTLLINAFRNLRDVLMMDCDPYKFLEILKLLESHIKIGYTTNEILYYKATCCSNIKGYEDEGLSYLKNVNYKKKELVEEANVLTMYAKYTLLKNDRKSFEIIKKDFENLPNVIRHNKFQKQVYEQDCKIFKMHELIWNEDDVALRELLSSLLQNHEIFSNTVIFHMHLARLDMKANEKENAKLHLDYVIKHGNRMRVVEEAKELREKLLG